MVTSVFEIFKVGIGPSSSHTVGPMRAALQFVEGLQSQVGLSRVQRVTVDLFGSLGATGLGHGSDRAVLLGLVGERPETVDPAEIEGIVAEIRTTQAIALLRQHSIPFHDQTDLRFHWEALPYHPNGMRFTALDEGQATLAAETYYSIGGGFVVAEASLAAGAAPVMEPELPYPFHSAAQLLAWCEKTGQPISEIMAHNEASGRSPARVHDELLQRWGVMQQCVRRGCETDGILPGGLHLKRRAPALYRQLAAQAAVIDDPLYLMDWVNLFAIAVNEENAAGGRVVTAPTNGAAGIIPAVLHYYDRFCPRATPEGIVRFLLTAGAIASLYKENASISGADVGCQGEVGVACSMAAGALAEVLGGTPRQVENAAEIAMEHNLGLTCDPIAGLVQIPCIERNAMGAVKAINAARIALRGDGHHVVSLDRVIQTMRATGADMSTNYKETSQGGLAVNVIEC